MLLEPSAVVLYVDNITISNTFYEELLGINSEKASPTFHTFKLSSGINIALKARQAVEPPSEMSNGNGELAFTVNNRDEVNHLFKKWNSKNMNILLAPCEVAYGYTFLVLDPDGNRLRVVCLEKSSEGK